MEVFFINKKNFQLNDEIKDSSVRVIDEQGTQLGIMSSSKALSIAIERRLDLVKIASQANPPVCRIMNYGKFKFEQAKQTKESRKKQKTMSVKEIRFSLNIDPHDLETKLKNTVRFLKAGNKVKVSLRFRGREMARIALGKNLLKNFQASCEEWGFVDKPPKMEGRTMAVTIYSRVKSNKKKS